MSLKEVHEMDEAAMGLIMLSEQVCDFDLPPCDDDDDDDDDSMDLEKLTPIQEKVLDCVESILDLKEMVSDLCFEKSTTCSGDVVALRSELQSKSSSHRCNVCGKGFWCYQALGGHKRLHRSSKGRLECKKENSKDCNSLFCDSLEAKEIVSKPSKFEVFQEEKMLDCVVLRQDFRELFPLDCKLQKRLESSSSYKCKVSDKSFDCLQALEGYKGHNSQLERKKKSLSYSRKNVSKPSSFEVSHCVELKQDFSELLSYSSSCSKTSFSTVRSELQKHTQSKSSYDCKICGESFVRSQALSNHQRVHRPNREKLSCKRKYSKDYNSLSDSLEVSHCVESKQDFSELLSHHGFDKPISCSIIPLARNQKFGVTDSEAKKICTQPLSFQVSQEKILHCAELKQDFSELFSHSSFDNF